jgi:hypothetical protein
MKTCLDSLSFSAMQTGRYQHQSKQPEKTKQFSGLKIKSVEEKT